MNHNKSYLLLAYSVSALLLAFYLYVLFLSANPRVSSEYRQFYIEGTSETYGE